MTIDETVAKTIIKSGLLAPHYAAERKKLAEYVASYQTRQTVLRQRIAVNKESAKQAEKKGDWRESWACGKHIAILGDEVATNEEHAIVQSWAIACSLPEVKEITDSLKAA